MQNAFEWWIGQQVVVQLAFGQIKVSLRGRLFRDQTGTLLMRPEVGSDIEIAKTRVLAIEEVGRCSRSLPWRVPRMNLIKDASIEMFSHIPTKT